MPLPTATIPRVIPYLVGSAGPPPLARRVTVPAEDRRLPVPAEDRRNAVPAEDRTRGA